MTWPLQHSSHRAPHDLTRRATRPRATPTPPITLIVALSLAALTLHACAEPRPVEDTDVPIEAAEPALPPAPSAEAAEALQRAWRQHKRDAAPPSKVAPMGPELREATLKIISNAQQREMLGIFYDIHKQNLLFFGEQGALTPEGQHALTMTRHAWTHGIEEPEGWPEVDWAALSWEGAGEDLDATLDAPLSDTDLRHLHAAIDAPADAPLPASALTHLEPATRAQLDEVTRLSKELVQRRAALDATMIVGVWTLAEAFKLPKPRCPRYPRRRRLACLAMDQWREDIPTRPQALLHKIAPSHPDYQALRDAFARYTVLHKSGGFPAMPEELPPRLGPGQSHPGVVALRARLVTEGFLTADQMLTGADGETFDATLSEAVNAFQFTRGLPINGHLDGKTLKALAVPTQTLLERLALGLRRWHKSKTRRESYYVRVNAARYQVQLVEEDQVISRHKAVVGKPWKRTPLFHGVIPYLDVHPWWYGLADDPKRVPPGPYNPLGTLVFRVNPRHLLIYLHGTNEPKLLDRPYRAFSSGCIRMRDPGELGSIVVDRDPGATTSEDLRRLMNGKRWTRRVKLANPLPVFFEYNTTFVSDDTGHVHFMPDIYRHDRRSGTPPLQTLWFPEF